MSRHMIQVPFGDTMVSRIAPLAGPGAYKTFSALFPLKTHWRDATCEEVECSDFLNGFVTTLDLSEGGQAVLAGLIRKGKTGRSYSEQRVTQSISKFMFPPGTNCFRGGHKLPLGRPGRFVTADGDWRGNPTGNRRVHVRAEDWIDESANQLDRIETLRNRG